MPENVRLWSIATRSRNDGRWMLKSAKSRGVDIYPSRFIKQLSSNVPCWRLAESRRKEGENTREWAKPSPGRRKRRSLYKSKLDCFSLRDLRQRFLCRRYILHLHSRSVYSTASSYSIVSMRLTITMMMIIPSSLRVIQSRSRVRYQTHLGR